MSFRPNWYEDERRRGGFTLGGAASWSALRWIFTITVAAFALQWIEASFLRSQTLSTFGALRAWWVHLLPGAGSGSDAELSFNLFFPVQLVTYALLHGGFSHILWNMIYLWIFGVELEAWLGRAAFLRLYIGGAVFGGLVQWAWWLARGEPGSVVGASGAVYAVMVLSAFKWPHRSLLVWFVLPVPVWLLVGARVVFDISTFLNPLPGDHVAVLAHLGGAAFALLWFKRGDWISGLILRHRRQVAVRQSEERSDTRREMDRILAKIQAHGLSSLDGGERAFLERRSRELRDQGG